MEQKIGQYSFIGGVILAVVLGLASSAIPATITPWLVSLLVLAGLVVGFLNVTGKETKEFLLVALVLVIVSNIAPDALAKLSIGTIGTSLQNVLGQVMAFVIPATIVIGLKDIWALGKTQ